MEFSNIIVIVCSVSSAHLYHWGGLKDGKHELEVAGDTVQQDVLLELILVNILITDDGGY